MIIDNLDDLPDMFKDGVRGILLLHRNKDGEAGNAQRMAVKQISRNVDEWKKAIEYFRNLQLTQYPTHRIYSSVNPRIMTKAIHEFKLRQIAADYGSTQELLGFYGDVQNRFFSCLMNPSCRASQHFLIDCDTPEEYETNKGKLPADLIVYDYATKNGRHIITKPFNPNDYDITVKKDDLLYIG